MGECVQHAVGVYLEYHNTLNHMYLMPSTIQTLDTVCSAFGDGLAISTKFWAESKENGCEKTFLSLLQLHLNDLESV